MTFQRVQVLGGDCLISIEENVLLTTVLGSCVTTCIYDPVAGVGGMNHYLLPLGNGREPDHMRGRYGNLAIQMLIDGLEGAGADRGRLRAKLYGGGRMFVSSRDIGELNSRLALDQMRAESIQVVAASLGGTSPRVISFQPTTGRCSLKATAKRPEPFPAARPRVFQMKAVEQISLASFGL
jgi:chemotaxis protein CheD